MTLKFGVTFILLLCVICKHHAAQATNLIDPTRPASKPVAHEVDRAGAQHLRLNLESTLVAPDRRVAVINGKLVNEGDIVDGVRVVKINNLNVLVKKNSKRITLQLLPDIIMKLP